VGEAVTNARATVARAVAVVLCSATAWATVLLPVDLGALVREAPVVARGRVAAVEPRWTDDRRSIETLVTLDVESYLKGGLGEAVTFRVPGGQLGRFRSLVVGAPEFLVDQHVVVFLGHRGPSVPYVLGLSQGVYRLAATADGWLVTPPAVVVEPGRARPIVRGDVTRRPLSLAAFERQVRALVAPVSGPAQDALVPPKGRVPLGGLPRPKVDPTK
jgi:hypothetical protein